MEKIDGKAITNLLLLFGPECNNYKLTHLVIFHRIFMEKIRAKFQTFVLTQIGIDHTGSWITPIKT